MKTPPISLALMATCLALCQAGSFAQNTPPTPPAQPGPPPPAAPPAANGPGTRTAQPSKWAIALETDPADLKVFRDANAKLPPPAPGEDRVVFMGDSITANWQRSFKTLFPGKPYIGRGYTSETTQQMLIRFRPDVIALKPKVVVILAGTNDIAGNTGRSTQQMIQDNLVSMIDLAEFNQIKVVLLSVLPASDYWWQRGMEPAEKIVALNAWMKDYAATRPGEVYFVDCHTPMSDEQHAMNRAYSGDGVHPNGAGYALISPLVDAAIAQALGKK
jgi:lysophospholipase L1-like esterase